MTVTGTISNTGSGNFTQGSSTGASVLAWPTAAQFGTMQQYAQDADVAGGDYDITGGNTGTNRPCTRLDFQVLDSNRDGIIQWDEGYVRVFKCLNTSDSSLAYVTARRWPTVPPLAVGATVADDPNLVSPNCGRPGVGVFESARSRYLAFAPAIGRDSARAALLAANHRCYLGGDPRLFTAMTGDTLVADSATVNANLNVLTGGKWIRRRSGAHSSVTPVRNTIATGGDAEYWIPLGKNPNFKGVIYVAGDVALSGRLRGRVSVVTTGNIVLADDFQYWTTPGSNCSETGDIFGAISATNVLIEDNNVQVPFRSRNVGSVAGTGTYRGGFDDTPADENYHMFMIMLGNWGGDIPGIPVYTGPGSPGIPGTLPDRCADAAAGCVRVTGGMGLGRIDWWTYWPVGNSNSSGWAERHAYDICGATNPPPYFPTTGRYIKSRYYELDPVWLNQTTIAGYYRELQSR